MTDSTKTKAEINSDAQARMGEIIGAQEYDQLSEVIVDDLVDHDPAPDQPAGREGIATFWTQMNASFSDLKLEPVEVAANDDFVTLIVDVSGTHTGTFRGHGPTGKSFTVRGVQVGRFVDGRMTERWGATDELGILQQLGVA